MDTLEDIPHIDPDPGKIHEQAEKQAANIDGLISLLQTGELLERTKAADIPGEIRDKRVSCPFRGDERSVNGCPVCCNKIAWYDR